MPAPVLAMREVDIVCIALFCFVLAVVSAVLPWINAELLLLTVAAPLSTPTSLLVAVVAVTLGQVTGKSALYWLSREARVPWSTRVEGAVERWRGRHERRPGAAPAMILVSATFGVPPFYFTTLAAGTLKIGFGTFLAAALLGRLLHFGAIAAVPGLVGGWFR